MVINSFNVISPEKVSCHLGELLDGAAPGGEVHVEVVVADGVVMDEDVFTLGAGDHVALQSSHRLPAPGHVSGQQTPLADIPVGGLVLEQVDEVGGEIVIGDDVVLLLGDDGGPAAGAAVVGPHTGRGEVAGGRAVAVLAVVQRAHVPVLRGSETEIWT